MKWSHEYPKGPGLYLFSPANFEGVPVLRTVFKERTTQRLMIDPGEVMLRPSTVPEFGETPDLWLGPMPKRHAAEADEVAVNK